MRKESLLLGGEWVEGDAGSRELRDRYSDAVVAAIGQASPEQARQAVIAARTAFEAGPLEPDQRARVLMEAATLLGQRREAVIDDLVTETGYPIADARNEYERCLRTLQLCGEEAKRIHGECVPIDAAPGQRGRFGFTLRVPRGVVCAITPFNAPLNTVSHKIGPALAAGNAVVLKPAEQTPVSANHLARALMDAGLPPGFLNVVHGPGEVVGDVLLDDPDIDFYGFTGSTAVGALIRQRIGLRPASLELGSISSTFVCADANLDRALPRILNAAFRKGGQVCTSIQRLYVERAIVEDVQDRLVEALAPLSAGDPRAPGTFVGPLITLADAERVEQWIEEALTAGARRLLGGPRVGSVVPPTVLLDVPPECRIFSREVFGPVINLVSFDDLEAAMAEANATRYGLTAGIFTASLDRAMAAACRMRVGTVHVNETCSARVDQMPSGGVRDSGMGREGPRYAIEEMTEERLITVNPSA